MLNRAPRAVPLARWREGARKNRFRQIDGRLYEGRLERGTIDDLTAHLGGEPTPAQQILIELSAKIVVILLERQGGSVPFDPRLAVVKFARLLQEYRLTHHCDIIETGNDSWRFKHRA